MSRLEARLPVSVEWVPALDRAPRRRSPVGTACRSEPRSPGCAESPCQTSLPRPARCLSPIRRHIYFNGRDSFVHFSIVLF